MNIQKIGHGSLAIYIEENELQQYGLTPDAIDYSTARQILENAQSETGIKSFADVELDVFPGNGSVLLFARMCKMKQVFFAFEHFEDLLTAIGACGEDRVSHLTYLDDIYFLSIFVKEGENPPTHLGEFGQFLTKSSLFSEHLEEHGKRLISWEAVSVLKGHFFA